MFRWLGIAGLFVAILFVSIVFMNTVSVILRTLNSGALPPIWSTWWAGPMAGLVSPLLWVGAYVLLKHFPHATVESADVAHLSTDQTTAFRFVLRGALIMTALAAMFIVGIAILEFWPPGAQP